MDPHCAATEGVAAAVLAIAATARRRRLWKCMLEGLLYVMNQGLFDWFVVKSRSLGCDDRTKQGDFSQLYRNRVVVVL